MSRFLSIFTFLLFFLIIVLTDSCKKEKETVPIGEIPVLTTKAVSDITLTTATGGGDIISNGGSEILAEGVCWSTNPILAKVRSWSETLPILSSFTTRIYDLKENTTYYVWAYATNNAGTGYGNMVTFTPLRTGTTVTDIDGNLYHTVVLGTQIWMVENLKTTKFNDGTPIPIVTNTVEWSNSLTAGYCWYNNEQNSYSTTYGALYNWNAVNTGKLAPKGWHVPTYEDWMTLEGYLYPSTIAGGKLKESGTTHWLSPNTGATNETGFTALPGGYRDGNAAFTLIGKQSRFWSTSFFLTSYQYVSTFIMWNNSTGLTEEASSMNYGCSVRCLKD
jgi:uncharacterized protein (TIGR02145 family)